MTEKENVFYVYVHRRGDNNEVFYVGKGCKDRAKTKQGRNKWWCNVVNKHGYSIEIVEDNLSEASAFDLEIELIKFYRECGHTLCNLTDGGEGMSGYVFTEEHRKNLGDACRGRKASEETKRKMSESLKGKPRSEETKEKIRKSSIGKVMSEEAVQKMRLASTGRIVSDETKAKLSAARIGRVFTQETKDKLSKSSRKVPLICSNGMIFDSQINAVNWLVTIGYVKASAGNLLVACKRGDVAYGFRWRFLVDGIAFEGNHSCTIDTPITKNYAKNAIVLLDNGELIRENELLKQQAEKDHDSNQCSSCADFV